MNDPIDRQAAIEAVCECCNLESDYHKCYGYQKDSTWCGEITALRNLPSAEPEIVRCKDCRWYLWTHCTRFENAPVTDEDFCSKGERREDG